MTWNPLRAAASLAQLRSRATGSYSGSSGPSPTIWLVLAFGGPRNDDAALLEAAPVPATRAVGVVGHEGMDHRAGGAAVAKKANNAARTAVALTQARDALRDLHGPTALLAAVGSAMTTCYYCPRPVADVVHDKRGCVAVCAGHEKWRRTTSSMPGHGQDCASSAVRVVFGGYLESDPRGAVEFVRHGDAVQVVPWRQAVTMQVQHVKVCPHCRGAGCATCWWDGRAEAHKEKWAIDPSLSREDFEKAKAACLAANQRIPGSASPVLLVAAKLRDARLGRT